jgi:hypothetical protein
LRSNTVGLSNRSNDTDLPSALKATFRDSCGPPQHPVPAKKKKASRRVDSTSKTASRSSVITKPTLRLSDVQMIVLDQSASIARSISGRAGRARFKEQMIIGRIDSGGAPDRSGVVAVGRHGSSQRARDHVACHLAASSGDRQRREQNANNSAPDGVVHAPSEISELSLRVRVKARPEVETGTVVTRILALYTAALHEAAGALNATRELGAIGGLGCGDNEGSHIDPVPYRLTATAGT